MQVDSCEEMIMSPQYLPEYMRDSRYFRIEYLEPDTGFSNVEGSVYLGKDCPHIYETLDKICALIKETYEFSSS